MKRYPTDKMCLSKRVYWSEGFAAHIARRCMNRRGVELRVYKCPHCLQYHLTRAR